MTSGPARVTGGGAAAQDQVSPPREPFSNAPGTAGQPRDPARPAPGESGPPAEPIGPSLVVRIVMRPMTKMLNPLILRLAGRRHFRMAAQIRHVGRRSGRAYVTPASARLSGGIILIPLTFGSRSDWSRNVRAAGHCSIRLNGIDYDASAPELLGAAAARPLVAATFGPMERAGFAMLGIKQVMRLQAVPAGRPGPQA